MKKQIIPGLCFIGVGVALILIAFLIGVFAFGVDNDTSGNPSIPTTVPPFYIAIFISLFMFAGLFFLIGVIMLINAFVSRRQLNSKGEEKNEKINLGNIINN